MLRLLIELLRILQLVVFIRVILTWVMPGRLPPAIKPIADRIDLVLRRFQVLIPMGPGYIDLGPMLFLVLVEVIMRVLYAMMWRGMLGAPMLLP